MNNLMHIIKNRRTTKPMVFTGEIIDDSIVEELLEAANWAPTHRYTEPWRFIVFKNEAKTQFGKDHAKMYAKHTPKENFLAKKAEKIQRNCEKTSHIIAVIMQRDNEKRVAEIEEISAVAAAIQNILLLAEEKQIASIWATGGMCYHPAMRQYLGFSEEDKVMGFIYLGKTDTNAKGKRISSAKEKTVWK